MINDTTEDDCDQFKLNSVKQSVIQGFRWATREGPLIEEQIRNVKYRLLGANLSGDLFNRGGGQIIPTARRLTYSSFLLASPRLMEPILFVEICCPADCISAAYDVLAK